MLLPLEPAIDTGIVGRGDTMWIADRTIAGGVNAKCVQSDPEWFLA